MSYQNSGLILSKVCYSNATHHFCMNSALPLLRPVLHLRENSKCNMKAASLSIKYDLKYVNIVSKIPNIVKSDPRYQFCTKTSSLFLRHLLDLQKTSKLHAKSLSFSLKYDSY